MFVLLQLGATGSRHYISFVLNFFCKANAPVGFWLNVFSGVFVKSPEDSSCKQGKGNTKEQGWPAGDSYTCTLQVNVQFVIYSCKYIHYT